MLKTQEKARGNQNFRWKTKCWQRWNIYVNIEHMRNI